MNFMTGAVLVLSFLIGCLGSLATVKWGSRLSLMDLPSVRSSHSSSTPKGGGIGILAACLLFGAVLDVSFFVLIPAAGISMIGFTGDRYNINPKIRLGLQLGAIFILLIGHAGHMIQMSGFSDAGMLIRIPGSLLAYGFWMLFIAGTANFYNFMDGINGIAAVTAIVAFLLLGTFGWVSGKNEGLVLLSFVLVFANAGFLPWNFPKAKVFMGDLGSLLLGFLFAAFVFLFTGSAAEFILMTSFLMPFYADEIITMAERIQDGEGLTRPHRRHLYQVLANEYGYEHWKVSLGYGAVQVLCGILVWAALSFGIFWGIVTLSVFFVMFLLINRKVKPGAVSSG